MLSKKNSGFFLLVLLLYFCPPVFAGEEEYLSVWLRQQTEKHPLVQAARQNGQASEARLRAARRAVFNPQLSVDIEDAEAKTSAVELSQTIDRGDVRGARTQVARLGREIAMLRLVEARQRIAAQLLTALAEWQSAQAKQQLADKRLTLMARFAELSHLRHRAGDLEQVEAELATLALSEARFQMTEANAGLAVARQALSALAPDSRSWPVLPTKLPELKLSQDSLEDMVGGLVEVRRSRAKAMLAQSRVALARSEAKANPTVAIRGGREDAASLVGLNVSIPLQVRNNFRAEIEAAASGYLAAQSEMDNVYRLARSRLHAAFSAYQLSLSAWRFWQESGERSLNQQTELLQRLWQAGELSTTDYLVQLKQALDTQASAYQQRNTLWRNWAEWLAASGRIEQWLKPASPSDTTSRGDDTAAAGE